MLGTRSTPAWPLGRSLVRTNAFLPRARAVVTLPEYLQPDILEHHATIVPLIASLLTIPECVERAAYALVAFTESFDDERVLPYLQPLMEHLIRVLQESVRLLLH